MEKEKRVRGSGSIFQNGSAVGGSSSMTAAFRAGKAAIRPTTKSPKNC